MKQFEVQGMSCSACSARVERAVLAVEGVTSCAVSLLTSSMGVEGTASDESIIAAVASAGYSASLKNAKNAEKSEKRQKNKSLFYRFLLSLALLTPLMYLSMGQMLSLPIPEILSKNPLANGILQMLLSGLIMVINGRFFINGLKGIVHRSPNMDTLISLGSFASFFYSFCLILAMTASENPYHFLHELYFESAGMILTLITFGKMLEERSKGKTTSAIKGLIELAPKRANVIRDGKEYSVDISEVNVGDVFVVRAGENIPVDAVIIDGHTSVDESALTGESIPVDKQEGDSVSSATLNQYGFITCRATGVGEDTALSKIIKLMSEASATKAPIAKLADRVSGVFVPIVIAIAVVTTLGWLIFGETVGFALACGISVLVISCPCALGLATPVAIMVGSGRSAKEGILFKTAEALEITGRADTVVFDKTGTITEGKSTVTDIIPMNSGRDELLRLAYALEYKSEHPLAKAIVEKGKKDSIELIEVDDFTVLAGNGVSARLGESLLLGGSHKFIGEKVDLSEDNEEVYIKLAKDGKTPLFFAKDDALLGIIAVADRIKSDSAEAIGFIHSMGLKTVMLTGDNDATASAIARAVGIDNTISNVLPDGKAKEIEHLQKGGRVIMVGDGINDAPALAKADIGFAIGTGTGIAIDAADVVLMNSRLTDVASAIKIGKSTLKNIKENLFWAFIYNTLGIPLAMGLLIYPLGLTLNPMIAAGAMSLSSLCVVTNALRLSGIKLYKIKDKKEKIMTKTLKVEGMMCPHCEARVKSVLEAIGGVVSAEVSHEKGTATVGLSQEVEDKILVEAVVSAGYKATL